MMLSTLYLLMLAGIFLQGMVKISTNHIIQLNQLSTTYQMKTAIHLSEQLIKDYIIDHPEDLPEKMLFTSSAGNISAQKNGQIKYKMSIIHENGYSLEKDITIVIPEQEEEKEFEGKDDGEKREDSLEAE